VLRPGVKYEMILTGSAPEANYFHSAVLTIRGTTNRIIDDSEDPNAYFEGGPLCVISNGEGVCTFTMEGLEESFVLSVSWLLYI
jgi:hypothetical protein